MLGVKGWIVRTRPVRIHVHGFGRGRKNAGAERGDHRGGRGPRASTNATGVGARNARGEGAVEALGQSSALVVRGGHDRGTPGGGAGNGASAGGGCSDEMGCVIHHQAVWPTGVPSQELARSRLGMRELPQDTLDRHGREICDRDVLIPGSVRMPKPGVCDFPQLVVGRRHCREAIFPSEFVALCNRWKRAVDMTIR